MGGVTHLEQVGRPVADLTRHVAAGGRDDRGDLADVLERALHGVLNCVLAGLRVSEHGPIVPACLQRPRDGGGD